MNEKRKAIWYEVYSQLAGLLVEFGKNNPSPGENLLNLVLKDSEFLKYNQWIDRNLQRTKGIGIDPIQIFTSFSRPKQNESNRVDRINSYFKVLSKSGFDLDSYDQIDFSGCPTPLGMRLAAFRLPPQQDEIWKAFLQIMREGQAGLTSEIFQQAKGWYGINVPSFSIFLFWINSSNFLPLDAYTASYIESNRKRARSIFSFQGYQDLLTERNTAVYRFLALSARGREKLGPIEVEKIRRYFGLKLGVNLADFPQGGELLGIRPRLGCDPNLVKVLNPGELFWFNETYQMQNDKRIAYYPDKDVRLYRKGDLFLEASAVVGKNGAGKSSLIELLLAVFNNIAYKKWKSGEFESEGEFPPQEVPGLNVEVYIKTLTVCKIEVDHKKIFITEFTQKDNVFSEGTKRDIREYPLSALFYTILINYSLYALNEKQAKPWLKALFHKNDAYQLPIVLDPFRKEGDIEVNVQTRLAKSRLLANLLEPKADAALEQHRGEWDFRKLTDFQEAVTLRLSLIKEKVEFVYKRKKLLDIRDHLEIVRSVADIFHIKKNLEGQIGKETMEGRALTYIVRKLFSMAETYPAYKDFRGRGRLKNVRKFLSDIKADPSHMAFKVKQAINYLKYDYLKKQEKLREPIESLSRRMEAEKKKDSDLQTIHLVPPSFFDVDIELKTTNEKGLIRNKEKPSLFNELSSGEKQQIYSISSIIYHLRNIHSLFDHPDETIVRYPYILLICDEIELYFHPELQRKFLSTLLNRVAGIDLSNIRGINLLFVTHSPFILSDIPRTNTLFLKKDESSRYAAALKRKPDSFGANIHELLSDGFFMSDTIGAFAKEKITEIIEFCRKAESSTDLAKLKEEYEPKRRVFNFVLNNIGEGYIKGVLKNHLLQLEELLGADVLQLRIDRLRDEIKELETLRNA